MKKYPLLLLACTLFACQPKTDKIPEQEWLQLFNGEDLSGWNVKFSGYDLDDNHKSTFRVEDGMLKVRYDEYEKSSEIFSLQIKN